VIANLGNNTISIVDAKDLSLKTTFGVSYNNGNNSGTLGNS